MLPFSITHPALFCAQRKSLQTQRQSQSLHTSTEAALSTAHLRYQHVTTSRETTALRKKQVR